MLTFRRLAVVLCLVLALEPGLGQAPCGSQWTAGMFGSAASESSIFLPSTFAVFDPDFAGPLGLTLIGAGGPYGFAASSLLIWNDVGWLPFGGSFAGTINTTLVFDDDGPGPNQTSLFVGGLFGTTAGVATNGVAKLTPSGWQPLLGGLFSSQSPYLGEAYALAGFDPDGAGPASPVLIVGGNFTGAGLILANNVAAWNGSSWSSLGSGITGLPGAQLQALAVFDDDGPGPNPPALFAAGTFQTAGGVAASNIAKWNGTSWSSVGSGLNGPVTHLVVFDSDGSGPMPPALYAAGTFTASGATPLNRIARWDGAQWSSLGAGPDADIHTLVVHDEDGPGPTPPRLFAGGDFVAFGAVQAAHVAKWGGAAWAPLGTGTDGAVIGLASFDGDGAGPAEARLWVVGTFGSAGNTTSLYVAKWTGTTWLPNGNSAGGVVTAMATFDPDDAGPAPPELVVGGGIKVNTPSGLVTSLARLDGRSFLALAPLLNGGVDSMAVYDPDGPGPTPPSLIVGGTFTMAGSTPANLIARWDGAAWSALGGGLLPSTARVFALHEYDPDGAGPALPVLVAGGTFTSAGGIPVNGIAAWNGTQWSAMGSGVEIQLSTGPPGPGTVNALTSFDVDGPGPTDAVLVVGGFFNRAGGLQAGSVAVWYSGGWYSLGSLNVNPPPYGTNIATVGALAQYDSDGPGPNLPVIVAAGDIDYPPGKIAAWIGGWVSLSPGFISSSPLVRTLHVGLPGSPSPVLFAGGAFVATGNVGALIELSGGQWSDLVGFNGSPNYGGVLAIHEFDRDGAGPIPPELFFGGGFLSAGGFSSAFIARYGTPLSIGLSLSTSAGPGSLAIATSSCLPGVNYFSAFTFDATNGIATPGTGPWAGLYIPPGEIWLEASTFAQPFLGTFDPAGGSSFSLPAGTLQGFSGMTLYGVTRAFDPATLTPLGSSGVASVTL